MHLQLNINFSQNKRLGYGKWTNIFCLKNYHKHTYNAYVISVIKPVPDLHTAAEKNCDLEENITHPLN